MPKYEGMIIRPPSEAESLIIQATIGCTDNSCTFCPAYKRKTFRIRPIEDILRDLEESAVEMPEARKIFLADGDAIVMPRKDLVILCKRANELFPRLVRIGAYASPKALKTKTAEDLKELRKLKLGILYLGIESGDPEVYARTRKAGDPEETLTACLKVKESGIRLNTTVILGLGGKELSGQHAANTAKLINRAQPDHVAVLSLMIVRGTPIHEQEIRKEFRLPDSLDLVRELHELISGMDDFHCLFFSNHASNYFPVSARFPKDKAKVLKELVRILKEKDVDVLRPDPMRRL